MEVGAGGGAGGWAAEVTPPAEAPAAAPASPKGPAKVVVIPIREQIAAPVLYLLRRGLKLPSQAAVISRDDDAFLDFVTPRVVRYSANPAIFARRLFQFIFQMVQNGPIQTRSVRLMPAFRPGETV